MNLSWLPYVLTMLRSDALRDVLRDLHRLTGGNVAESNKIIRRMQDRGYVLKDAEAEVDARIQAVRDRQRES